MLRFSITTIILSCIALFAQAQEKASIIQQINFYADVTANAGLPESRAVANEQLTTLFENYLSSDQFSDEELDQIAYLSVKRPEDKSFVIITWQYIDAEKEHHYSGYIRTSKGELHKLRPEEVAKPKMVLYEQLTKDNWYGALYYNIMPTKLNGKDAYLLFGYDGHKGFEHRKVLDVLQFVEGEPVFGGELFKKNSEGKTRPDIYFRLLLEYSNDANVSLNYNDGLGMITFDHLISRMGRNPGQGPTMVPDGSYMGYKWDGDTYWNHVDKLYDQVSAVPPTDGRKRDSGRSINGDQKLPKVKKKRE